MQAYQSDFGLSGYQEDKERLRSNQVSCLEKAKWEEIQLSDASCNQERALKLELNSLEIGQKDNKTSNWQN